MPVRTAYAGAAVSGEVLTAANVNKLPGGWIGYSEVTAGQGSITTSVDLTGLTVTVTVGSSRRIRVEGRVLIASTVTGDIIGLGVNEGATSLASGQLYAATSATTLTAEVILTPTAGSHTYKLTAGRAAGSGTVGTTASSTAPAYILVEDLGPAT